MSELIDAIEKVSGNTDPAKAQIRFADLDSEFFASEVKKETVVPQAQVVQPNLQNSAPIVHATPNTSTEESKPLNATNTNENSLDSKAVILFADVVLSRLLQVGFSFGGIEANAKDFQLTPDEIKKIEPVASVVLNKHSLNLSPEWLLAITLASIYGAKIIMVLPEGKAKGEAKKARIQSVQEGARRGRKTNAEREKIAKDLEFKQK